MAKHIHIITWDVPYPANYGGSIDIFYQIKALKSLGVDITLHCFEYGNRTRQTKLNEYCKNVFYYKRKNYLQFLFSKTPFIIASRKNKNLLNNLLLDDDPILFEAIHTTAFINNDKLKNRIKLVRTLNVESDYYTQLALHTTNIFKKTYYQIEAKRLKNFEENKLQNVSIACIAQHDRNYFKTIYPNNNVSYIGPFHPFQNVEIEKGIGNYCLYHGNLSVDENNKSALWLAENIFNDIETPIIFAGANASNELKTIIDRNKNMQLVENPDKAKMDELIKNAQIHVLPSFQDTGLKLKLIHALFSGRHCIVNNIMLAGTNLQSLCTIAETKNDWKLNIKNLFEIPFTDENILERKNILEKDFNVISNAKEILKLLQIN